MSTLLSRLGRFSAQRRWLVIPAWLLLFAALIGALVVGSSSGGSGDAEISMPDTAATKALSRMDEQFPSTDDAGDTLQLVFQPTSGDVADPATQSAIAAVIADAADLPGVASVSDPFDTRSPYVSEDGTVSVATIAYGAVSEDDQKPFYDAALALQQNAPPELGVELGGNLVPLGAPAPGIGEGVGVLAAFVVLALTFGSLLAAGANLLVAIFGVGFGVLGVLAFGAFWPIGENSIILAAMLGLAVGIDYSLFILSRVRTELRAGRDVEDAIARAAGTAGTAVVFAGMTVIVALIALLVADLSYVTEMGVAAAFAVAVDVLLALTLLPALLRILGTRILPRRHRRALERGEVVAEGAAEGAAGAKRGALAKWADFVVKRPVTALVAGIGILIVVAVPMTSMKTASSIPGGSDPTSTERAAYDLILDEFGGIQSPVIVLAEGDDVAATADAVQSELSGLDHVQQVMPAQISEDGTTARFIVIPDGGPIDDSTADLVHDIRDRADDVSGAHLEVTGEAAIGIDQDAQLMQALIRYVIVIVLISIALMIVLFRSLLIPVIATLGYLLSVGASFGASVAVFQWGWFGPLINAPQGDPMISMLPMLLVGVLFGLAMDYQVFLVSRIQEAYRRGSSPKAAVMEGVTRSGPVLVAAASIMIVVFAGFATSSFAIGASIAFGLMVGVAADAFIVRLVLMPALLSLLGRSAWWIPAWLDRILPDIDVEGHALDAADASDPREGRDEGESQSALATTSRL